jgi:hypothetical protein
MSNPKYIAADAETVKSKIALLLSAYPDLEDDADLLADMLEGETNLNGMLERIMDVKFEAEDMDAALELRGKSIQARRERCRARADAMKDLALSLMHAAKLGKIELTECTLSIRKPSKRVEILNEDDIPSQLMRVTVSKSPDKPAIKAQLEAGETVPGCVMGAGEIGLTVRRG